ncbi:serine hydrolase, partial [Xanthomonas sp. Kuri4-3]
RKARVRVADLLRHAAGFATDVPFHDPSAGERYSHERERTQALLTRLPLDYPTGSRNLYSDTDFLLAGLLVERLTGQRLDAYVENAFYRPLGLQRTRFAPLAGGDLTPADFAATEPQGNTRGAAWRFRASAATPCAARCTTRRPITRWARSPGTPACSPTPRNWRCWCS